MTPHGPLAFDDVFLTLPIESGAQPLTNADDSIILTVNGEIYNHRLIRKNLKTPYHFKTTSDCEVIIPLVSHPRRLLLPTAQQILTLPPPL